MERKKKMIYDKECIKWYFTCIIPLDGSRQTVTIRVETQQTS